MTPPITPDQFLAAIRRLLLAFVAEKAHGEISIIIAGGVVQRVVTRRSATVAELVHGVAPPRV
jgi:hypothetical protein